MSIANILARISNRFRKTQDSAKCAKDRLQIIIAHERVQRDKPDYFAAMQKDLLEVIARYVAIDKEDVRVELDRQDGCSILELNVILPQEKEEIIV